MNKNQNQLNKNKRFRTKYKKLIKINKNQKINCKMLMTKLIKQEAKNLNKSKSNSKINQNQLKILENK